MMTEEEKPPINKPKEEQANNDSMPESGFDPRRFARFVWVYAQRTLSIREGVDPEGTIEGIRKDIDFKGPNVWVLVASIFIASIGLNVDSTAVIIGAMLISPLMGPILGIGLATGTNNWSMLTRSLRSLGTAVGVSLLTSTLYFSISPFGEAQSELLARTQPQLLDVFVAFFGGVAGIVAGSRKEKTNVIPGVAIATALMPPLCTAGYGLASGNMAYFFGAMYLFLINSVFIAISTFIIVRYLRFPLASFVDPKREKKFKRYLFGFVAIVVIPSIITTFFIVKDSFYRRDKQAFMVSAERLVDDITSTVGARKVNVNYEYSDTGSLIQVFVLNESTLIEKESELNAKLGSYGIMHGRLDIIPINENSSGSLSPQELTTQLQDLYRNKEDLARTKDEVIAQRDSIITDLLVRLKGFESKQINFTGISEEIKIQYPDAEKFSYALSLETDVTGVVDTIPTLMVKWRPTMASAQQLELRRKLEKWLTVRLEVDTLRVLNY